jgi:hypothetical protein
LDYCCQEITSRAQGHSQVRTWRKVPCQTRCAGNFPPNSVVMRRSGREGLRGTG